MKRILVSANDPGGANALVPVVQAALRDGDSVRALLTGPACQVFTAAGLSFSNAELLSKSELLAEADAFAPDVFLGGTSVKAPVERSLFAHLHGRIPTVYILDFWSAYTQRFSEGERDLRYLPDLICVPNELAQNEMVKEGIPADRIVVTGNPHFEHFADEITLDQEDHSRILFVSQPISTSTTSDTFPGFDEYQVVTELVDALTLLPEEYHLDLRLHPRDELGKYDNVLSSRVRLSSEAVLEKDLSRAGLIVGMFSPVLIQAAVAGRYVLSFEPGLKGDDPLPTNRSGDTPHAYTKEDLRKYLVNYKKGLISRPRLDSGAISLSGATERILAIVRQGTKTTVY